MNAIMVIVHLFRALVLAVLGRLPDERVIIPDDVRENAAAPPAPNVKVVEPVIKSELPTYWYFTPGMHLLLDFIGDGEGGVAGYNADFQNDDRWELSKYRLDDVIKLAASQVTNGGRNGRNEKSSAIGKYQFLSRTLASLKQSMALRGDEQFVPAFQDNLAVALMVRRGLMDWLRGSANDVTFGDKLAMEWASLPVLSAVRKGSSRTVYRGQSYYAGDGLNKSQHSPDDFAKLLSQAKRELQMAMPRS